MKASSQDLRQLVLKAVDAGHKIILSQEESSHCPFYEEADAFNEIVRSFVEHVSG